MNPWTHGPWIPSSEAEASSRGETVFFQGQAFRHLIEGSAGPMSALLPSAYAFLFLV